MPASRDGRWRPGAWSAGLLPLCAAGLGFVDPPHGRAPEPLQADAALVLSGDVDFLRVRRAADLYRTGAVPRLVLTGNGIGGDDAVALKQVAARLGVPEQAVLVEPRSRSTRENLLLAGPLIRSQGFRRVALVTSGPHMGRTERVARRTLPGVTWLPVPVEEAGPPARVFRQRLLEWLKFAGYGLRGWL